MHVDHRVELLIAHLADEAVPGVARVVDDDIDAAEPVDPALDEIIGKARRRDRSRNGQRLAANGFDFGNHLIRRVRVQIVQHHIGAVFRKFQRDGAADAAPGTGDIGGLACKFAHLFKVLCR